MASQTKTIKVYQRILEDMSNDEHVRFCAEIGSLIKARISGLPGIPPLWETFNNLYRKECFIHERHADMMEAPTLSLAENINNPERKDEASVNFHAEGLPEGAGSTEIQNSMDTIRYRVGRALESLTAGIEALYVISALSGGNDGADIVDYINDVITRFKRKHGNNEPNRMCNIPFNSVDDFAGAYVPHLTVASQVVFHSHLSASARSNNVIEIKFTDADAFSQLLYPEAKAGVLYISGEETDANSAFSVKGFRMDERGESPIALLISPPLDYLTCRTPSANTGTYSAKVFKDNIELAILDNFQYPATGRR
ncbi:MAG: hypothetical protein LBJ58_06910 [Tannerellaceae bacterium]|jgi:hypothetical protein|nr:hypothetical protein [Tannerellaceae bacterium]